MAQTTSAVSPVSASPAVSLADLIVKTPDTCSGRARISGTRIKVEHVYNWMERQGMTPAEVIKEYPHLTMAQVHAALAYYWSHQEEIQRDIEEGERVVAELMAKTGSSKIRALIAEQHGKDSLT